MATYKSYKSLKGNTLEDGDKVIFKVGKDVLNYDVCHDCGYLNTSGPNCKVFDLLGMSEEERKSFASEKYGDDEAGGDWPSAPGDDEEERAEQQTRLVLALFKKIEGKHGKAAEEKKKKVVSNFKPGMRIDEYVKKELKGADEERKKWLETYLRCVLPERVRNELEAAITIVLRRDVFEKWGLTKHFEKGITNSILLYGPPGTGKTMVSESIAAIIGKNLMTASSGDIQSSIPGKTELNIRGLFKKAQEEDCVLLLDECDSILADRNMVGHIMAAEINELLTQIERFDGVVILTTNRLHHLDPALQRRIVAKVKLENPTKEARIEIWKNSLPKELPLAKDVSTEKLADIDMTGGEIKNAVLLSARMAIAEGASKVEMRHFVAAIEGIVEAKREYAATRPRATSFRSV